MSKCDIFGWVWVAARFLTTRLLKLQNEKLNKGIFAGDSLLFIQEIFVREHYNDSENYFFERVKCVDFLKTCLTDCLETLEKNQKDNIHGVKVKYKITMHF